jgi:fatty-acyl-CoA synthase
MNQFDTSPLRASRITLANLLKTAAARYRDREAVFCSMTGRRFSFGEVNGRMNRLANALLSLGVKKGDHCAFYCRNRCEAGEIYGALVKIGAIAVPLHGGIDLEQIIEYLAHVRADYLLFEDIYAEGVAEIRKRYPDIKTFIGIGKPRADFALPYEDLIAGSSPVLPSIEVASDDIQCIDTTSRTTGVWKIYPLTHANGIFALGFFTTIHEITKDDVILTLFPLFTRVGLTWYGAGFLTGARNVFFQLDTNDLYGVLKIIQEERITLTNWPPILASLLLKLPDLDQYDLSSLRGISFAGSRFPVTTQHEVMERICPNIYEYYALQEAGVITHMGPEDKRKKPASVGTLFFGTDLRIVDKDGIDVPTGEIGQIICRSIATAPGYYEDEAQTRSAYRDGWFYTDDYGRMDKDEFLYFLGRKEDMIVAGGKTIFAGDVEEAIAACTGVLDAAVIGLPDDALGEAVVAVVVRDPRVDISRETLISWCRDNLPPHQVPRRIIFSAMLPRNNIGKVTKYVLVERYSQKDFRKIDETPGPIG